MTSKATFEWASYVEKALLDLDDIPLMGNIPKLDLEELEKSLSATFKIDNPKLKLLKWHWYTAETITENLGEDATCLNFSALPIQGKVSWVFPAMDLNSFITWVTEKKAGSSGVINSHFIKGLLAYASVEVLHNLEKQPLFEGFLLRYLSDDKLPTSRALGLDIQMTAYGETLTARLLIPETFRKNWMAHFSEKPKSIHPDQLDVELTCSLEAGHIYRTLKEWREVKLGDFIPLENCQVDPDSRSGSLNLTVGRRALYRVRIKEKGLKILDQPLYEEETMSIEDEIPGQSEVPGGEEIPMDPEPPVDMDDNPAEVPEEGAPVHEEKPLMDKVEDVPLNISIELSRFKMTCGKLLQLKPGNILELGIHPEKPVDLVSGGKKIAEAELVRVGEVLGVRILNLG